jgi:hypothetical protein
MNRPYAYPDRATINPPLDARQAHLLLVYLYGKLFTASDFEEPPSLPDSTSSEAESELEERRKVGSSPELARENMR